jgi:hypothetical protein
MYKTQPARFRRFSYVKDLQMILNFLFSCSTDGCKSSDIKRLLPYLECTMNPTTKQQTDTPKPGDAPSLAFASAEEMSSPPDHHGNRQQERGKRASDEEEVASSDEKIMPGVIAKAGAFTGPRNRTPSDKTALQQTDTPTPGDTPSSEFVPTEEMSPPPELQGSHRQEREQRERRASNEEEEEESLDEEMRPGAVAVVGHGAAAMAGLFTGRTSPTSPSVVGESQGPSAIDDQSTIMGEMAGPSPEDEER